MKLIEPVMHSLLPKTRINAIIFLRYIRNDPEQQQEEN